MQAAFLDIQSELANALRVNLSDSDLYDANETNYQTEEEVAGDLASEGESDADY